MQGNRVYFKTEDRISHVRLYLISQPHDNFSSRLKKLFVLSGARDYVFPVIPDVFYHEGYHNI